MSVRHVEFTSETEFEISGVRFVCCLQDYTQKTTVDRVVVLKDEGFIRRYEALLEDEDVKNVLEVGIFQGGMAVLMPLLKKDLRYLGMDIIEELPAVTEIIEGHPEIAGRAKVLYEFPQGDPRTYDAIDAYFGDEELDLVVDDASHMYGHTKSAFSEIFPRLKAGGIYIIEDWAWAHWKGYSPPPSWLHEPSPTLLLAELCAACGESGQIIERIEVNPSLIIIHKGRRALDRDWKLDFPHAFGEHAPSIESLMVPEPDEEDAVVEEPDLPVAASEEPPKAISLGRFAGYWVHDLAARIPFLPAAVSGRMRRAADKRRRSMN